MTAQTPYIWNKLVFCFSECLYAALAKKWTSYYIVFHIGLTFLNFVFMVSEVHNFTKLR